MHKMIPDQTGDVVSQWNSCCQRLSDLAHWGWDKMAANLQTTFSNAFSWMKTDQFQMKYILYAMVTFPNLQLSRVLFHVFEHIVDNSGLSYGVSESILFYVLGGVWYVHKWRDFIVFYDTSSLGSAPMLPLYKAIWNSCWQRRLINSLAPGRS